MCTNYPMPIGRGGNFHSNFISSVWATQLLWKQLKEESCAEEIPVFSLNSFSNTNKAKFHNIHTAKMEPFHRVNSKKKTERKCAALPAIFLSWCTMETWTLGSRGAVQGSVFMTSRNTLQLLPDRKMLRVRGIGSSAKRLEHLNSKC
jgi:hypothetical protein